MRTITLEILRHGPPHNQLLSPLTQYLALCENHAAVSITVPHEHAQFLHRLRSLSYEMDEPSRIFQVDDTGREMGKLLGGIPSLIAELTQRGDGSSGAPVHLRMIVSASELALLPFELAISPNGLPGEARSLLLQTTLPVCLTREVRQPSVGRAEWNSRRPRILFAAASPPGVAAIPLESHLLALRRAVDPWVGYAETSETTGTQRGTVAEHLVVLPNATVEQIREKCASDHFTHIHILAHGIARQAGIGRDIQYGLALHDARNPKLMSVVDGRSLARALRTDREDGGSPARPLVVTLASCHGGAVGDVVDFAGAGASVAHALHAEGIPVVVASQFPLTFRGSVRMVEVLYRGFLEGEDPRILLHDLRGQLHTILPDTHDWGSVVAYAALDTRVERELERFQVDQSHRRMKTALAHAAKVIKAYSSGEMDGPDSGETSAADLPAPEKVQAALERVVSAKKRLDKLRNKAKDDLQRFDRVPQRLDERDDRDRSENHLAYISGMMAAAQKYHSELIAEQSDSQSNEHPTEGNARERIPQMNERRKLLAKSMDDYWDAFYYERSNVWALVQHVFVQCALTQMVPLDPASKEVMSGYKRFHKSIERELARLPEERECHTLWKAAVSFSLADTRSYDHERELWAHGNLLELYLIAMQWQAEGKTKKPAEELEADGKTKKSPEEWEECEKRTGNPSEHIARIQALAPADSAPLDSEVRQLMRYARKRYNFCDKVCAKAREWAGMLRVDE